MRLPILVTVIALFGCTEKSAPQPITSRPPVREETASSASEQAAKSAAPTTVDLSGLKGLRLGMGMGAVQELRVNTGGFDGSKFECGRRKTIAMCSAAAQSVADLPVTIVTQFVATTPYAPPKKIPIPDPYINTGEELRRLSIMDLVQLNYERDAPRRAALTRQAHANNEANDVYRLADLRVVAAHDSYETFRAAVIAKWGEPRSSRTQELRNAMNASFSSRIDDWTGASATMQLQQRCDDLNSSCLDLHDKTLGNALAKALADDAAARARDL